MIVVFGSVNADLTARVSVLPVRGETVLGRSLAVAPGGKGANQALAARRAGADVAMAGAVGDDSFAEPALALLAADGVDLAHVRRVGGPTGVALIHVDDGGDNTITVIAGANAQATAALVPDALLGASSLLVLQLEVPVAEALALATRAHAAGRRVMLNAAPAAALGPAWLRAIDVLVVNEIEAATLAPAFGAPAEAAAFATTIARRHGLAVVVTRGGQGALAVADGAVYRVPTLAVQAIDTVGAGDAFVGALAAALDRAAPWREALAFAAAAGGLACTGHGAQAALPRADILRQHASTLVPAIVVERLDP